MSNLCNEFSLEVVERLAKEALSQWGYDCHVKVESADILCITVFSRNGVDLDGQYCKFRFCRTPDLTHGPSGRHRANYYFWLVGLAKFSSDAFWLTRGHGQVRGASSDSELAYHRDYDAVHHEERLQRWSDYRASHREEILQKKAEYYAAHHDEIRQRCAEYRASHREECRQYAAARRAQLWTNGVEILRWSTLKHRGRKSDLLAAGWHLVE